MYVYICTNDIILYFQQTKAVETHHIIIIHEPKMYVVLKFYHDTSDLCTSNGKERREFLEKGGSKVFNCL